MAKLEYTFKNDTLFKMLFVRHPDLLKRLVAELLRIKLECIEQFEIRNPELPPESLGDKFCRLDINMTVNGQRVDLEIQVRDEGDFPERTLFHWAREYSTALGEGGRYHELPRVVIISIVAFTMFDCEDFHSEFQPLEVTRHTPLTDKQSLHYFELPKLPAEVRQDDELRLWLALFKAETEEELRRIEALEVPIMEQAIEAFRSLTATSEFREIERLRSKARHDEAQALYHARLEATLESDEKWRSVVAEKDAVVAEMNAENARLREQLAALQARLTAGK
ncbi:MAG: Rpn family recombination-promoting nuclease/putative transposase [Candidatus Adiutrix sp.]|jgi:predicted transposase/invertase (TIGR01784 family)|nr:Rpn family recombination-promoting nuclease/putative transposase [Candidatus Adiutrix sp.]